MLNVETGAYPSYVPGAMGAVWAGTISSTDTVRNVTITVNGQKTVNPTPNKADGCTATTEDIKLNTATMITNSFAQNGIGENAGAVRFVSELGFSADAFSETGYVVKFGEKTSEIGGSVVYTSLKVANGQADGGYDTITPTGKYYIAYGISNIPTTVSGTISVTSYAVLVDGTTTVYGATAEYTLASGVLQQNS